MSEIQIIESALEKAAQRHRWTRAFRGLWLGLLVGAILSLLLLLIYHVAPLPLWTLALAAVLPFPCLLLGFIAGGWRKASLAEVARFVDGRRRLQERLSTALEVSGQENAGTWKDLVLHDAATHARNLNPSQLLPFHLPKVTRWAVVALVLGAGLGFVPEYRSKSYLQKQTDQRNIKEAGQHLVELTKRSLEKRAPVLEPTKKSLEVVTNVGDQLITKAFTRSEALKDLANVADKLKDELKQFGQDPALRKLEQAARNAGTPDAQTAAGLQKQLEELKKQIGTPVGKPDALEKLQKSLEKLQENAKGMAGQNSGMGEADKQKLSESLSALSREAQDLGVQMPQLDEAINALAANQTEMFLKDLQAATSDLEKMKDMAKNLEQLQQQMEKLGKDLAEQLKNGQPEAAQQTLQKMISQLKAADLKPEQLQQMMQEVAKAVDPAGNYGKVGDHLKNAAKQMQGSDKSGAAKSLAEASKELDKLMQQLGDAQQLQETLEALNQASMSIGSGQGWRACKNPGFHPGGKPGSGVGTWADDEGGQWNGEWTRGWDNSGIKRDEMDPRGVSDRGEGELSDALKPTKVKGQFSPGGQMPSITLKGVSIKGQSKVAYEQAAAAAQSDAQSALSQEKVPRAYQGAVRDYFDDLKK